jgi:putative transposase
VLLYLPTYSSWLNRTEMLWRHFRREVTHCELFPSVKTLICAAYEFFERYNKSRGRRSRSSVRTLRQLRECT